MGKNVQVEIINATELDPSKIYIIEINKYGMTVEHAHDIADSLSDLGIKSAVIVLTEDGQSITVKEAT